MDKTSLVVRLAVGIVFLVAALSKVGAPRAFAKGIAKYDLIPMTLLLPASWLIISVELIVAIAHFTGLLLAVAIPMGLFLLLGFGAAVALNLLRGRNVPCYCFGPEGELISSYTLVRTLILAAAELLLWRFNATIQLQHLPVTDAALAFFWAIFLIIGSAWIFRLPDIIRLARFR